MRGREGEIEREIQTDRKKTDRQRQDRQRHRES